MLGVSFRVRFIIRFRVRALLVSGSGLRLGLVISLGSHSVSGLVFGRVRVTVRVRVRFQVFAWVGVRVKSRDSVRFTVRIRYWFKVHIRVREKVM